MKVHKTDLINLTWHRCKPILMGVRSSKATTSTVINMFLDILKEMIINGDTIEIQKLMSITPVERKPTRAYSFKEGDTVKRNGGRRVRVRIASEIKERIKEQDDT